MDGGPPSRLTVKRKSSNLLGALKAGTPAPSIAPSSYASTSTPLPDDDQPPPPPLPSTSGLEGMRASLQKRLTTWGYVKRVHAGRALYMNAWLFSRDDLESALSKGHIGGAPPRAHRLAYLGMSVSNLLDMANPSDFLRAVANLMADFDGFDGEVRPKTTKSRLRPIKRKSGSMSLDGDDSYLMVPNIPFDLDYFQVLFTLCDVLAELYTKILVLLGGSPAAPQRPDAGLGISLSAKRASASIASPDSKFTMNPAHVDQVHKIDGKFKKLLTPIIKELESLARDSIRRELAELQGGSTAWDQDE